MSNVISTLLSIGWSPSHVDMWVSPSGEVFRLNSPSDNPAPLISDLIDSYNSLQLLIGAQPSSYLGPFAVISGVRNLGGLRLLPLVESLRLRHFWWAPRGLRPESSPPTRPSLLCVVYVVWKILTPYIAFIIVILSTHSMLAIFKIPITLSPLQISSQLIFLASGSEGFYPLIFLLCPLSP